LDKLEFKWGIHVGSFIVLSMEFSLMDWCLGTLFYMISVFFCCCLVYINFVVDCICVFIMKLVWLFLSSAVRKLNWLTLNIRKLNLVDFQVNCLVQLDAILKFYIFPNSSFWVFFFLFLVFSFVGSFESFWLEWKTSNLIMFLSFLTHYVSSNVWSCSYHAKIVHK